MYVLDTARVFPPETPCREVVGVVIPADYGKALREVRLPMKEWEVQVRRGGGEATSCLGLQLRYVCACVCVCGRLSQAAEYCGGAGYEKVELRAQLSGLTMLRQRDGAPNLR